MTFYETSAYWELPVGENNSFVAAPWFEQNFDTDDGWRGEAMLGFKQTLHRGDNTVVALQGGALWISHPGLDACGEGGAEVRLLAGGSLASEGAVVNFELATRALDGGCEGERLDLTAGYRPNDDWLVMGQLFLDAPRDGDESVKAQFTLVRFGDDGRGIQIGVRARIDDGAQEPAIVIGLWGRPGN